MKGTGVTRPIDPLGRVVIPKEIRERFNLEEADKVEFFVEGDRIIIKKLIKGCHCCNNGEVAAEVLGIGLCKKCIEQFENAREIIDKARAVGE